MNKNNGKSDKINIPDNDQRKYPKENHYELWIVSPVLLKYVTPYMQTGKIKIRLCWQGLNFKHNKLQININYRISVLLF